MLQELRGEGPAATQLAIPCPCSPLTLVSAVSRPLAQWKVFSAGPLLSPWSVMAKGEYEFPILVTCLLILGLQIHNPFQPKAVVREACSCDRGAGTGGTQTRPAAPGAAATSGSAASAGTPRGARAGGQRPASPPPSPPPRPPPPPLPPPPAYRRGTSGVSSEDLLREQLESIQVRAREQQETLAAAGRMPPPSEILQHLRDTEEASGATAAAPGVGPLAAASLGSGLRAGSGAAPARRETTAVAPGAARGAGASGVQDAPQVRSRAEFGRFLDSKQPGGLGVVLGVGRGEFALRLLGDWRSLMGLYLVDPYIHIWRGYDDPANLPDNDHQMVFEGLRNRLAPFEGRYVLVRDFSHSFGEVYAQGGTAPGPPSFVYVDANHAEEAVSRDLEIWWALLRPGGILAGSTYTDDADLRIGVRSAVDKFFARHRVPLLLTQDDALPSWFAVKP